MKENRLQICEVGPRDGLQSFGLVLSVAQRVAFIEELMAAGLHKIEVGSMVNPKYVPEMAESGQVYATLIKNNKNFQADVQFSLLVPNQKGLADALAGEVDCQSLAFFTATSESFNQKNIHKSVDDSTDTIKNMINSMAPSIQKRLYISTAFHCPYDGKMKEELVIEKFENLFSMVDEISIGDTTGKAELSQVENLATILLHSSYKEKVWWHFHDTYQRAKEFCQITMAMGFTKYDSSAGGIGGCPFAPGAKGNISTEILLLTANEAQLSHSIDIEKVACAAQNILQKRNL